MLILSRAKAVQEENRWLDEYIFTGADGRITVHQLSSCMKNKCSQIGIRSKGINAYRRTVNSLIRANGLSAEAASAVIGNTPAVNNQYYTFDVTEDNKKYEVLDQVNQFMLNPGGIIRPLQMTCEAWRAGKTTVTAAQSHGLIMPISPPNQPNHLKSGLPFPETRLDKGFRRCDWI